MPRLKINDVDVTVEAGTPLIEACRQAGFEIPHYCYHQALRPVATCRMCVVEVKGQAKLVTSCNTPAGEGMEVHTDTPAVQDARAGVMEFLLANHPLDCPICDQAGECRLQDYSYQYGSGDSRMTEPKRRYRYEELGGGIILDKNRCIHCTRCVRFTQEISGGGELCATQRGAHLEITTYEGSSLDGNPLAGNLVDICPVGALTSQDFRFSKRAWYLKPIPTISRHSAMATPLWADVEGNRVWRFRPRALDRGAAPFILDEERYAYARYNLDPATRERSARLRGAEASPEAVAAELAAHGPVAVAAQGTFGCDTVQRLAQLASTPNLLFGTGDITYPLRYPALQVLGDGIFNRRGCVERGYVFGHLEDLLELVRNQAVGALVLLHDEAFAGTRETELLQRLLEAVPFSLVLEPLPSALSAQATATLPVATYLEESDFAVNHEGRLRRYQKALEPPPGVRPVTAWVRELQKAASSAAR